MKLMKEVNVYQARNSAELGSLFFLRLRARPPLGNRRCNFSFLQGRAKDRSVRVSWRRLRHGDQGVQIGEDAEADEQASDYREHQEGKCVYPKKAERLDDQA